MAKHVPERSCILTRAQGSQGELMRFVRDPDGNVVPDLRQRLPGRGAWLTPTAAALTEAIKRRLFTRAFKGEAKASPDLVQEVDAALQRDLLGALALANKAGAVTTGFFKVDSALRSGQVVALIHAQEASEDGRRKLAQAKRVHGKAAETLQDAQPIPISSVPTYDDLRGDDLDMALGRVHVIHAALLAGAGSEGCLARWRRLRRFRGLDDVGRDDARRPTEPERGPDRAGSRTG